MKTLSFFAAFLSVGLAVSTAFAEPDIWITDFGQAKKIAAEKSMPILADFTGSDWCSWCIKLDKEVFSQDAFLAYAKDNLVLLKLDFPRRLQLSAETVKQNKELADRFGIEGFPTIILLDAEGKQLAKTSYKPGGAEEYVKHLKSLLSK